MGISNSSTEPTQPVGSMKVNLFFAILLIAMTVYFLWWGLDYTMRQQTTLFIVATAFGVFMAFNIGGNDVANSFGTSVGAGTLTIPQAQGVTLKHSRESWMNKVLRCRCSGAILTCIRSN